MRAGRTSPWRVVLLALLAWLAGLVSPGPTVAAARLAALPASVPGEGGFSHLVTGDDGRPATFDPCRPVRWVLRPDGMPVGGEQVLRDAVAEVARSTGLRLLFDGETDEAPSQERPQRQPERYGDRPAPVLVAWTTEFESPALTGSQVGLGVTSWTGDRERLVTGQVLLDRKDLTTRQGRVGPLAASTVLHELAHVVGLGHVDDRRSVMNATVLGRTSFSPGDLRGLRELGSGPCS